MIRRYVSVAAFIVGTYVLVFIAYFYLVVPKRVQMVVPLGKDGRGTFRWDYSDGRYEVYILFWVPAERQPALNFGVEERLRVTILPLDTLDAHIHTVTLDTVGGSVWSSRFFAFRLGEARMKTHVAYEVQVPHTVIERYGVDSVRVVVMSERTIAHPFLLRGDPN